jgi:hypothetical protein
VEAAEVYFTDCSPGWSQVETKLAISGEKVASNPRIGAAPRSRKPSLTRSPGWSILLAQQILPLGRPRHEFAIQTQPICFEFLP